MLTQVVDINLFKNKYIEKKIQVHVMQVIYAYISFFNLIFIFLVLNSVIVGM